MSYGSSSGGSNRSFIARTSATGDSVTKVIYNVEGDFHKHINPEGETRTIRVYGDYNSYFDVKVQDEDGNRYNFDTQTFGSFVSDSV